MFPPFVDKTLCSRHSIFPGVDIYTAVGDTMMLSLVEMQPGAVVEWHSHSHEQVGIVLEGEAEFFIGTESRQMRIGDMYRIAGHVPHRVVAGSSGAKALDVFHPIRDDYR